MSKDWYLDLKEFQKEVILANDPEHPCIPDAKCVNIRKMLIKEEIAETLEAIDNEDLVEIADGIADSIVVLLGTAVSYGIDIRPVWEEVHKTNMTKKGGPVREDGKRLKPPNWQPPDIKSIIDEQIISKGGYCGN